LNAIARARGAAQRMDCMEAAVLGGLRATSVPGLRDLAQTRTSLGRGEM
jgi:hypothetical protein